MDKEMLRLRAHVDQARSEMREMVVNLGSEDLPRLIKTCAAGRLEGLDEREQLMVGMLAVVAIFNLIEAEDQ
jgi:hypothetical protein